MSPQDKVKELEFTAAAILRLRVCANISDDASKSYDPLTIDLENKIAHSYIFDFFDGGRHHKFNELSEVELWLNMELFRTLQMMKDEMRGEQENEN